MRRCLVLLSPCSGRSDCSGSRGVGSRILLRRCQRNMQTGDFARERPTLVETLISLADRARKAAAMSEQKFEDQVQRCSWRRAAPIKKSNHRVARRPSGFTVAGELAKGGQPHQRKSTGSRIDPVARACRSGATRAVPTEVLETPVVGARCCDTPVTHR